MERMTGLDASMLYSETPTAHMHTMKVAVLDVTGETGHPFHQAAPSLPSPPWQLLERGG